MEWVRGGASKIVNRAGWRLSSSSVLCGGLGPERLVSWHGSCVHTRRTCARHLSRECALAVTLRNFCVQQPCSFSFAGEAQISQALHLHAMLHQLNCYYAPRGVPGTYVLQVCSLFSACEGRQLPFGRKLLFVFFPLIRKCVHAEAGTYSVSHQGPS